MLKFFCRRFAPQKTLMLKALLWFEPREETPDCFCRSNVQVALRLHCSQLWSWNSLCHFVIWEKFANELCSIREERTFLLHHTLMLGDRSRVFLRRGWGPCVWGQWQSCQSFFFLSSDGCINKGGCVRPCPELLSGTVCLAGEMFGRNKSAFTFNFASAKQRRLALSICGAVGVGTLIYRQHKTYQWSSSLLRYGLRKACEFYLGEFT